MKLKIIAKVSDGIIACNKNNIVCFQEKSLSDDRGEDALYWIDEGIQVGRILKNKNHQNADFYWCYSRKEWNAMTKGFKNIDI